MNGPLYRLYHELNLGAWVCWIKREHACVIASYRDVACTRCSYIGPRTDERS